MIIYKLPECTPVSSLPKTDSMGMSRNDEDRQGKQPEFHARSGTVFDKRKGQGRAACSACLSAVCRALPVTPFGLLLIYI